MGQICISADDQQKLIAYENQLKEQTAEKEKLNQKLQRLRAENINGSNSDSDTYSAEKIEQLQNEKKQVFKTMLKEKKKVSKLEDEIEEYKKQLQEMEDQYNQELNNKKRSRRDREQERANRLKTKKERLIKEREQREANKASNTKEPKKQPFGLGSVMDGIKKPNLDFLNKFNQDKKPNLDFLNKFNQDKPQQIPFKIKNNKVKTETPSVSDNDDDNDNDGNSTSEDSDDEKYQVLQQQDTILLDIGYDAESEATHVYEWLHGKDQAQLAKGNKQAIKQLKQRLASILTSRSEGYRQTLVQAYRKQYGVNLEKDIKKVIQKGHTLEIIHGLLMTRAEYDAVLISRCVADWDITPVAGIICCRSLVQIKELHIAYKKKCKLDIKKQLQALAQKDKKRTLVKIIGSIFNSDRIETADVNMNECNKDLNFILTQKKFKDQNKEKLVLIFTANSVEYIKVLNEQFKLKSKDSLTTFIDKKLGPKSTAGIYCKTRIKYALDTPNYYAKKIQKLGFQWKKNQTKIADIFIQRMETDLDQIQRRWRMNKYGDKDLRSWIVNKTSGSKSGVFLCKMLDNCGRYAQFNKQNAKGTLRGGGKIAQMMM